MSPSRKQRSPAMASFLAAAAAIATAAPSAFAATTVTYNAGGTSPGMNVTDDPGNAANLVVTSGTQSNHVGARSINGAPLTAGAGCIQVSASEVSCFASGPRIVTADLGDGHDHLGHHFGAVAGSFIRGGDGNDDLDGADQADSLDGGAGDDLLQGASGDDVLNGGPGADIFLTNHLDTGNDVKNGGDGNDRIIGFRDPGNDVYTGGAGVDLLDFRAADVGIEISLDGVANDGPSNAGQADNAGTDIENLKGGSANDTLVGNSGRNLIEGFAGNDTLRGGSPPSRTGTSISFLGDDTLDGGIGSDVMHGEGGDDRLLARDAVDDQQIAEMSCGAGNDRLDTDLADVRTRPLPADCESIDQGAIDEGPNVRIASGTLRVSDAGTVGVRLRCPASVTRGCRGTLAAGAPQSVGLRGLGARSRYRIRRGRTARVTIRLPRALRHAAVRPRLVRARIVSLETGSHGPKTTVRPVRLR